MTRAALQTLADPYPQNRDWREVGWLDRQGERLRAAVAARLRLTGYRQRRFVARVERETAALEAGGEDAAGRSARLQAVSRLLRRDGPGDGPAARAFALVRVEAAETLGLRHFATQIRGAYGLIRGAVIEMDTGEGKSLTATLAAATMALAGRSVSVVTVNDYLAARDAEAMTPLYRRLGLSVGFAGEDMDPNERRAAYARDIVYCTSKTLAFDYLRDRIDMGERMRPLRMALDRMSRATGERPLLRGLQFVIVDEADSVLVDEARTPLIISAARPDPEREAHYRTALDLARSLKPDADFVIGPPPALTEAGREHLDSLCAGLEGLWTGRMRREESVVQALTALHMLVRDVHYIVRDDRVMLLDENTGRVMPDRSWERGLQQIVELAEGVPTTPEKETLARISFQLFMRRVLILSGMTGTCREVAGEIGEVYGLPTVRVRPRCRSRRRRFPARVFADDASRAAAVTAAVRDQVAAGRPVLVGTRSIALSETVSAHLEAAGIAHGVLNAKQDGEEAAVVAAAGGPARVTIATSMAGRGTDIKLAPGVADRGGLHVILTGCHDSARVDRQLVGRCARQGDPGSHQALLCMDDPVLDGFAPRFVALLRGGLRRAPDSSLLRFLGLACHRAAQKRIERRHRRMRRAVLKADFQRRRSLSFTGEME